LVDVQVNSAGKVVEAKPIMGSELLQTVARQAALEWRFKPLKSVSGTYSVRLTFIFHDAAYVAPEKKPDFTAPGVDVCVLVGVGALARESGTSFATPLLAASAALVKQLHPTLAPMQLRAAFRAAGSNRLAPDSLLAHEVLLRRRKGGSVS